MDTLELMKVIKKYGSVGKVLVDSMFFQPKLEALKYLYQNGKDLVYINDEFVEAEFPEKEFLEYTDGLGKTLKTAMHLIKNSGIYAPLIYSYAIVNRYGVKLSKDMENYFEFVVNEYLVYTLENYSDEFDDNVLNDFYEYITKHEFKYVNDKYAFIRGAYKFLSTDILGSFKDKFEKKILEFLDKIRIDGDMICAIYELYKDDKSNEELILRILNRVIEEDDFALKLIAGLFIKEKFVPKKMKYQIAQGYIEYLKEVGKADVSFRCNGGKKYSVERRFIKVICDNFMDLWDDLRKGIKGTKYCNEKWECCKEGIFDVFDI